LVSNTSKSLDDLMGSGLAPEIRLTNVSYVYPEAKKATPSLSEGSVAGLGGIEPDHRQWRRKGG